MKYNAGKYDVAVIGAGHAGCRRAHVRPGNEGAVPGDLFRRQGCQGRTLREAPDPAAAQRPQ